MARTTLTVNDCLPTSLVVTGNLTAGTADGHQFTNTDENVVLLINNTNGGAARGITIPTPATVGKGSHAIADATKSVAASNWVLMGPFENRYFQQSDGFVHVDFDDGGSESDSEVYAFKVDKSL